MSNKRIIVVEPSPFRRDETYVIGPFGRIRAWFKAHWINGCNPWGMVWVVPDDTRIELGNRVLWAGGKTDG
jgi:hypothetical protein